MSTVLLTGFEPFAGAASNSSGDAVALVASRWRSPITLVTAILPVTFGTSLDDLIARHSPDVVIATGLAGGRAEITPERVAINLADARIPDAAGAQPLDLPVVQGGPVAYFTGLPVKSIVARMLAAGIPAAVSSSAGSYVCNAVMYRLMRAVDGTSIRAGFIHVPASTPRAEETLAEGVSWPSLDIESIARGLEIAISVALEGGPDARLRGGAES